MAFYLVFSQFCELGLIMTGDFVGISGPDVTTTVLLTKKTVLLTKTAVMALKRLKND